MIITAKSFIDNRVSTYRLNRNVCIDLGYGNPTIFKNSFELVYRAEIIAITHYVR